jgi:hypothetical protein
MNELLLPHQLKAAGEMFNGCILKGATGTGKTITALAYYDDCEDPGPLYVITTAKKRDAGDWEAEGRLLAIFPVVDSWQNLARYEDVKNAFFVFDEQRVIGSGPWVKSFLKIARNNRWVMLSATPGDTWLDYIPVFVANGFYVNRTEFQREHVVYSRFAKYPKVERILGTAKLERLLASILVEMPFEKRTVRHETVVYCDYRRDLYEMAWKRRWNYLEDRPIRNISELCSLLRRALFTHPSRLERIRDLLIEHPRMIIFYNFDYELEILRTLGEEGTWNRETVSRQPDRTLTGGSSGPITISAGEPGCTSTIQRTRGSFAVAEWNGHNHDPIPDTDEWVYLVQYRAGAEGWNCFSTDTTVFYSMTYSYRMFEQAKGRTDRIGTIFTDLYYFVLRSPAAIDTAIWRSVTAKKDFNEKAWARSGS